MPRPLEAGAATPLIGLAMAGTWGPDRAGTWLCFGGEPPPPPPPPPLLLLLLLGGLPCLDFWGLPLPLGFLVLPFGAETAGAKVASTKIAFAETASAEMTRCRTSWR
uniref:Secreted protein n=1 Tax=Romanomermis culicivorax TaxID=13658 RepID=A0A915KL21_ROMCU